MAHSAPKLLNNYQNINILAETLRNNPQPDKKMDFIQLYESEFVIGKLRIYSPSPYYDHNTPNAVKLMGSKANSVVYAYSGTKKRKLDLKQIVFVFLLDNQQGIDAINNVAGRLFEQISEKPSCDPLGCRWTTQEFRVSIVQDPKMPVATVMIAESNLFR
tara:strand:- start:1086 stop:1565 length:480 start_codon:yes stop_codon:yes gene_type:complete